MSNIRYMYTGCFFLSDIFETLITPSILKISRFCKVVMTNKTGIFDNLVKKFVKTKLQHAFKQLEYRVLFKENSLIRDAS